MSKYITYSRLVLGYQPKNFISDIIFPVLTVSGSPIKIRTFGKEMFRRFFTRRAELANSNISGIGKGDYVYATLDPRDSVKQIDKEHTPTVDLEDSKGRLPITAKHAVWFDREIENADRLSDTNNYPTGNKITMTGTDQFNDYENSQPIQVVDDAMYAVSQKIGNTPNTMIIPEDVFKVIKWHPDLAIVTSNSSQVQAATIAQLQEKFSIDQVVIARGLKLNEDTDQFEYIYSKVIIMAYINPSPTPSREELSFSYCFREKGYPFVDDDIEGVDKQKKIAYRYNDKFDDFIVCGEAAYLINAAIA